MQTFFSCMIFNYTKKRTVTVSDSDSEQLNSESKVRICFNVIFVEVFVVYSENMHPAQQRLGVEVFIPGETVEDVPCCPHGPMLMFERYFESKPPRKFYSCSACRDRKECSFFQWADEKVSTTCQEAHNKIIASSRPPFKSSQCWKRLQVVQSLPESDRFYCHSCSQLLLPKEHSKHKNHELVTGISNKMLASPSHFLKPLEKKKTFAQYLFTDSAVDFFLKTFKRLGYKKIVCIGAPRIHDAIQSKTNQEGKEMDSLLLDLDHRYAQFNDDSHFIHYNMFNHHFFDKDHAKPLLGNFFQTTPNSIAVVMDPPFGGLVQILAASVKKIWKYSSFIEKELNNIVELPTFWIFPYFMETHIVEELPSFKMCHYKVDYDNHPLYKKKHGQSSKTSPVRIFTNVPARDIVLPEGEGYRFCEQCQQYVSENNIHCEICNDCTSKDGRVWIHCDQCNRCVKQGRVHCQSCNRCELPTHICQRSARGCHVCGDMSHKRKDCPKKSSYVTGQKRKQGKSKVKSSIKRRKTVKE